MEFLAAALFKKSLLHVVQRLGGPGLIGLGLIDNSVIPLPGGMDAATILLAAAHHDPWWYYAIMSTVGALLGGYLTFRLGVKGGEETLQKKMSKRRADQVSRGFRRFGFWSITVSASSIREESSCWRSRWGVASAIPRSPTSGISMDAAFCTGPGNITSRCCTR
jgi:membrane protein YqaA with SNARE-associated domain